MARPDWITKFAFLRNFLAGLETFCIVPTAWSYIKSLDQSMLFLSLTLSAYNAGALFATPLFGYITDRLGNPRVIYICSCTIKVLAYVIYSVNSSAYFPFFGRLLSGVGEIGVTVLLGQIALQVSEECRGASFVLLDSAYCIGSVLGPVVGGFITFRINVFGWEIDEDNSPGIVLTIIWLIHLIFSVLLPNDMWMKTGCFVLNLNSSDDEGNEGWVESFQQPKHTEGTVSEKMGKILLNSTVTCILFLIFCSEAFSSTSTFYVPLLALDHFHLQLIHSNLLFLNSTLFTLILFICLYLALKYVDERKVFAVAMILEIIAILLLVYIAFSWDQASAVQHYILLLYVCFGMPYFIYPLGSSLLSKITDPSLATFVQGLSYAVLHFAIVASRIAVSFVFTRINLLCYCLGMAILWFASVIWYGALFKNMVPNN